VIVRSKFLDVTGRNRLEGQALKRIKYTSKIDTGQYPDIAWLKDTGKNRYVAVNKAFSLACGMEPSMVVGRRLICSGPEIWRKKYWWMTGIRCRRARENICKQPFGQRQGHQ